MSVDYTVAPLASEGEDLFDKLLRLVLLSAVHWLAFAMSIIVGTPCIIICFSFFCEVCLWLFLCVYSWINPKEAPKYELFSLALYYLLIFCEYKSLLGRINRDFYIYIPFKLSFTFYLSFSFIFLSLCLITLLPSESNYAYGRLWLNHLFICFVLFRLTHLRLFLILFKIQFEFNLDFWMSVWMWKM